MPKRATVYQLLEDALGAVAGGDISVTSSNSGSVADLGDPPIPGLTSKERKRRGKKHPDLVDPRTVHTLESRLRALIEADEVEDQELAQDLEDEAEDRIAVEGEDDFTAPAYGAEDDFGGADVDDPNFDVEDAEQILQDEDPLAPETGEEEEEEEEEEDPAPKISMARILKYKVSKRRTNRHADPEGPGKIKIQPDTLNNMRIGTTGEMSGIGERLRKIMEKEGEDQERGDRYGPQEILARLTHNNGSYILSTTITAGNENREYVFEGDRTRMISILTVLGASLRDNPGTPRDAVALAVKQTEPLDLIVNYDRLLTYGQSYAQQVIAQ